MLWRKYRYKLVYMVNNIEYTSCMTYGMAQTIYYPNEWVTSPAWLHEDGMYPLVFKTKKQAIEWGKHALVSIPSLWDRYKIFKCEVKGRHYKPREFLLLSWLAIGVKKISVPIAFPEGTEAWEYVKLVKEVKL